MVDLGGEEEEEGQSVLDSSFWWRRQGPSAVAINTYVGPVPTIEREPR